MDVDAAHDGREAEALVLLRKVHVGVRDLAEMALEAGQLALGVSLELRLETIRAVVQDDLHSLSIDRKKGCLKGR